VLRNELPETRRGRERRVRTVHRIDSGHREQRKRLLFSITTTLGRLSGDFVVAKIGDRAVLFWGSLVAIAGVILMITSSVAATALLRFLVAAAKLTPWPRPALCPLQDSPVGSSSAPCRRAAFVTVH
jgi:hypothetical protein